MARSDPHPSQGPVPSYSSISYKTSAAETVPNSYAAPTDPQSSTCMTKPLYDHPPAANDGAFFPIYPDFYDTSSMDYSAVAAANGQENPEVSVSSESDIPYPPGWDYGTVDVQMQYSPLSPGTVRGEENALQPQDPWNYGPQAYPALVDTITGSGMLAMADPIPQAATLEQPAMAESMFQHALAEDSTNGCYDSLRWPYQPPMGQISPSPSQSSYYISSPASGAGAHYSRHNSCSSLPAARVAALEQTRFDARFQPVPDQAVSPGEGRSAPGGSQAGADSYTGQTMRQWGDPQSKKKTTTTTTDPNAGTVSPAMTPSPRDSIAAVSSQPATKSARNPSNQQSSRTNKRKDNPLAPAQQTTKQKQAKAGGRSQSHQQQEHSQAGTQAKGQAAAEAAQSPVRHRNRDAANKCRAKTKKAAAELESTERAMSSEHRELSAMARNLREEVLMLKNELLAHGSCDDDLIQHYLTTQARRVGYGTGQPQPQPRQQ